MSEDFHFKVAGMSYCWKIINIVCVLVPKMLAFVVTARSGVQFLMETSGIEDVIVNCVAVFFLLRIDEMMYDHVTDAMTRAMMERIEDFQPETHRVEYVHPVNHMCHNVSRLFPLPSSLLPFRLFGVVLLTVICICDYYDRHCTLPTGSP